jgi:ribosomal-protein-alanine N-acetyltransferase
MKSLGQYMEYSIRLMEDKDIPQAIEIDREAFPTQWPHPTYTSFKQEIRNRLARYLVAVKPNELLQESNHTTTTTNKAKRSRFDSLKRFFYSDYYDNTKMAPPQKEYLIGMSGFWIMAGEAHIITIAVRNDFRRNGIGERLLIETIDVAQQLQAKIVTLEVRVSNTQAQTLYEKYGFNRTGIRNRYYADNGENAYIMTTETISSPAFQSRFTQLKQAYEQRWGEFSLNNPTTGGPYE